MAPECTDSREMYLSDVDLALIHALQVDARAPWSRIAHTIGVDAATVARRWSAIAESGAAWLTVLPPREAASSDHTAALVLVQGEVSVADTHAWARLPWVSTVERTSCGVMITVAGPSPLADLDEAIRSTFAGSRVTLRVEYVATVQHDDSDWRLRALTEDQSTQIRGATPIAGDRSRPARDAVVDEVAALLRADVRMSLGAMAAGLGVSDATARRTVDRLVGQGLIRVGCDLALPMINLGHGVVLRVSGWRAAAPATVAAVLQHPNVHRVLETVGPAEATISLRAGSLAEGADLERQWPALTVLDRWTVTSTIKRNGRLLGADGRCVAYTAEAI